MLRLVSLISAAVATVVALLIPGPASAVNGCPAFFQLIGSTNHPADRNADGLVCIVLLNGAGAVVIDNNVPDRTAPGVVDDGSSVIVDTQTGEILGG